MGHPIGKVKIEWTPNFAYAIGLIVTDGSISQERHIILTSKDEEQIINFKDCLGVDNQISRIARSNEKEKKYFRVQFGDVLFVRFLSSIGVTSKKTFSIKEVNVPDEFFFDFLRGFHDGDGTFYSYWDKRWKSSFMYYLGFYSASKKHLEWLERKIHRQLKVAGRVSAMSQRSTYLLRFAKKDSLKIIKKMYHSSSIVCLSRKYLKINNALSIVGEQL